MSFWDNVKKFAQPYADDEYDEYDDDEMDYYEDEEEEVEEAPRPRRRSPFSTSASSDSAVDFSVPPAPSAPAAAPAASVSTGSYSSSPILSVHSSNKQEVVLFHAKAFDDAAKAADELRGKKAVILNMENVDKALTRRVVDFLSGCVYAVDGKVKKIAQCTYLFCPHSMDIVGDLETFQSEVESYI